VAPITITKVAGLLAGALVSFVLLVQARVPRPAGSLDAALTLTASPTGELGISPSGIVMRSGRIAAGAGAVRATLEVRNQTGVALDLKLAAKPSSGDLDEAVRLLIADRENVLFDGRVNSLRSGSRALRMAPGEARRLRISARLLPDAPPESFEGRSDEVALELSSTPSEVSR
jgi:hypothetical protein